MSGLIWVHIVLHSDPIPNKLILKKKTAENKKSGKIIRICKELTLVLLNKIEIFQNSRPLTENTVDPDQLASHEAS